MKDLNCPGPIHNFSIKPKRLSEKEIKKETIAFGRKYVFCSLSCYNAWKKQEFGK